MAGKSVILKVGVDSIAVVVSVATGKELISKEGVDSATFSIGAVIMGSDA